MKMSNHEGNVMKLTRTLTTAAITASLMLTLAACSQPATQAPQDAAPQTEKAEEQAQPEEKPEDGKNTLLSDAVWPENEVTALVPKPEFSVPLKSVSDSDSEHSHSVSGQWDGITQDEAAAYVQKLKDAGFTVNANESSDSTMYTYSAANKEIDLHSERATVHVMFADYETIGTKLSIDITLNRPV